MKIATFSFAAMTLMGGVGHSFAQTALPSAVVDPSTAAAVEEFQVVRAGDTQMSCEALVAEINGLNAEVQAMQQAFTALGSDLSRSAMAATRQSGGGGGALGIAGMLASFVPGGSMVAGGAQMLRQEAAQAAAQARQQEVMDRTAEISGSITALAPRANRAAHLSEILRSRSC